MLNYFTFRAKAFYVISHCVWLYNPRTFATVVHNVGSDKGVRDGGPRGKSWNASFINAH